MCHEFINLEEEIHKHDFSHKQSFEYKELCLYSYKENHWGNQNMSREMDWFIINWHRKKTTSQTHYTCIPKK